MHTCYKNVNNTELVKNLNIIVQLHSPEITTDNEALSLSDWEA